MQLNFKKINFKENQRILVASDLHGHLNLLNHALEKCHFDLKKDALVICGDLLEKGENSLGLLQKIMRLQKLGDVYVLMGNCDCILDELTNPEADPELLDYMNKRKLSILNEMKNELHLEVNTLKELQDFKHQACLHYAEEIDFVTHLPQLLDSDHYTFVHAGITMNPLENQDPLPCMTTPAFFLQPVSFKKPVIVGHWPVANFSEGPQNFNIRFNPEKNIISLDGGLGIKKEGQLNVLEILPNQTFRFLAFDEFPKILALENQKESESAIMLSFPDTEIQILEERENTCRCIILKLNQEKIFAKEEIFPYQGKNFISDFTDYHLAVKKGELLSLIEETPTSLYVKKEGVAGWYDGEYKKSTRGGL